MNNSFITIILLLLLNISVFATSKKSVESFKINTPLTIDGILNESVYQLASPAKDFVQLQPHNGKPAFQPTDVYIFYDQSAIYVGAMLYDNSPDSIFNYLTERDNTGMSDYFGIYFDPYNQGQLAYGFFITPAGVQIDIKAFSNVGDEEDGSWNAVWESKTSVNSKGWVVEMRIPFSELRFSDKIGDSWGLNIFRNIRRFNSNNSWNFIDRTTSGFIHQEGELKGLKDIKPPVRLSFSPYLASYMETTKGNKSKFLYKGGLDLKYGINESFTLDMMLIPDFGQIQSDDKQLNLSPFELYYSEKRQFFNEGTELFNRANIFYSRRIGASPKFSPDNLMNVNEELIYNPIETQLVNATKISGRTKNGIGIGMLNAMSLSAYAQVTDTILGKNRNIVVQPFTNYNVTVFDKSLKNNSFVSIINSNVSMFGNPFRANVIATEFSLNNNKKTYALKGKGAISVRGDSVYESGFSANLGIERTKGKIQYGISHSLISDTYNPNDLGYLRQNNQSSNESWISYNHIEQISVLRDFNVSAFNQYVRMYQPNVYSQNITGFNSNFNFKNNYGLNINGNLNSRKYDYFESRVKGRYFIVEPYFTVNFNLNTDSRKNLNFELHYGHAKEYSSNQYYNDFSAETSLRLGQRFEIEYELYGDNWINGEGFVSKNDNNTEIIFAKRDVKSFQNVISTSYVINNKSSLSLRTRHYWSGAKNKQFYQLQTDGSLKSDPAFNENSDLNFNSFTVDMMFRWNFAPGSELVMSWKKDAYTQNNQIEYNYWKNLSDSWLNQYNTISLKVLYYIDYNRLRKKKNT